MDLSRWSDEEIEVALVYNLPLGEGVVTFRIEETQMSGVLTLRFRAAQMQREFKICVHRLDQAQGGDFVADGVPHGNVDARTLEERRQLEAEPHPSPIRVGLGGDGR